MSEFSVLRRNSMVALGAAAGIYLLAGCSGDDQPKASETPTATHSVAPPIAEPGQHVNCHQVSGEHPRTLRDIQFDDGQIGELGEIFHQSSTSIEKDAASYVADCDASLTGSSASQVGFFVDLAEVPKSDKCVTYTALYPNKEALKANSLTNRFMLICAKYGQQATQGPPTQV